LNFLKTLLITLFFCGSLFAQDRKITYAQFDVTLAFTGNPKRGEVDQNTNIKEPWLIPDGVGTKFGYGLHYKKWVGLGIHGGLNWDWSNKLVVVPVFTNFRLSQKIGEETRITLQLGIGKAIALGRGNLTGDYQKISLGLQNADDVLLFIELNHYAFPINNQRDSGNISLGVSLISF
jgi:hypothetical protein